MSEQTTLPAMLRSKQFRSRLAEKPLIIDGALATELELRSHDLNHPLWSAKILRDDANSIKNVHLDYYLAGADVATTASYQATTRGLTQHFGLSEQEGLALIRGSVEAAKRARDEAYASGVDSSRQLLVAGSVGPYGAYLSDGSEYRGDYVVSVDELQDFHRPRIRALLDAGADLLALETIPSLTEIEALLELLRTDFPTAVAWLGVTTRDATHLADGTPLDVVLDAIHKNDSQIIAFGVNCVPLSSVPQTLRHLSQHTSLPLLCYPNSGEVWDAQTKTWSGARPNDPMSQSGERAEAAPSLCALWTQDGARVLGGCCRTGPAFIRTLAADAAARKVA